MRLGLSTFLNCQPFYHAATQESLFAPPKALASALLTQQLDASLISATVFLDNNLTSYPFGIAATAKTMSVLLFLRDPHASHLHIATTSSSETAVTLLRIILEQFWQRPYTLFTSDNPSQEECSGYLLIGDEALFHQTELPSYDLATLWHEATGLPFVFALFASHHKWPDLPSCLESSLTRFFQEKQPHQDYFACLTYRLEEQQLRGLDHFNQRRHALR